MLKCGANFIQTIFYFVVPPQDVITACRRQHDVAPNPISRSPDLRQCPSDRGAGWFVAVPRSRRRCLWYGEHAVQRDERVTRGIGVDGNLVDDLAPRQM